MTEQGSCGKHRSLSFATKDPYTAGVFQLGLAACTACQRLNNALSFGDECAEGVPSGYPGVSRRASRKWSLVVAARAIFVRISAS